jgi:hypothetical protein
MLTTRIAVTTAPDAGQRAVALARRFERTSDALAAAVEHCPDTTWQAAGASRGWSTPAGAREVADQIPALVGFIDAVASCRPLPPVRHDAPRAPGGKDETLTLLRRNGTAAASLLRGLSDEQLERSTSYFGAKLNAAHLVDELLIAAMDECRLAI